jgi:hypothetical protein
MKIGREQIRCGNISASGNISGQAMRLRFLIVAMSKPEMANSFAGQLADALESSWPAIARPNKLPPPGEWQVWLLPRVGGLEKPEH